MRARLTLLLIVISALTSFASLSTENIPIYRNFDQSQIESYKANPAFSYVHASQRTNWWAGVQEWLVGVLSSLFDVEDKAQANAIFYIIVKVILWIIALSAIGIIVHSLYKKGVFGVIGRKEESFSLEYHDLDAKVLETDWQVLIVKAIDQKQFNVAIRLLYLQLLQTLNNAHLIEWDKSKTIRDYQGELNDPYREGFTSLARYYQYSWFGNVSIDELHFYMIQDEFKAFKASSNVE